MKYLCSGAKNGLISAIKLLMHQLTQKNFKSPNGNIALARQFGLELAIFLWA